MRRYARVIRNTVSPEVAEALGPPEVVAADVASLQAKHSRECSLERPWTTFDKAVKGCSCPVEPV